MESRRAAFDTDEARERIEGWFEGITASGLKITSPQDRLYNCLAWAIGETDFWYEPAGPFAQTNEDEESESKGTPRRVYAWPDWLNIDQTIGTAISFLRSRGFREDGLNLSLESGVTKIAIFGDDFGDWTHFARQLPDGRWASKCGKGEDIEHVGLHHMQGDGGDLYGTLFRVMREVSPSVPSSHPNP